MLGDYLFDSSSHLVYTHKYLYSYTQKFTIFFHLFHYSFIFCLVYMNLTFSSLILMCSVHFYEILFMVVVLSCVQFYAFNYNSFKSLVIYSKQLSIFFFCWIGFSSLYLCYVFVCSRRQLHIISWMKKLIK